jgi:hypothetical protein
METIDSTARLDQRPFTHPEANARDLAALKTCQQALIAALADPDTAVFSVESPGVNCVNDDHRIVLYHPEAVRSGQPLGFVGFCGLRRPTQTVEIMAEMDGLDGRLLAEMVAYPDVLSYSSLRLNDDNYVNLVVLRTLDAIETWRSSAVHKYAADVLSPRYYFGVRIHNGLMRNGVTDALSVTSTKYYDFETTPTWRGLRPATP